MNRSRGTRQPCRRVDQDCMGDISVFVLVLLPDLGHRPEFEDHYPLSDPYYRCAEAPWCRCPLAPGGRQRKLAGTVPGGAFDGRVLGEAPLGSQSWMTPDDRLWDHNLVRPMEMAHPVSAFAVITPDGLWHECIEPEPQDMVARPVKHCDWRALVEPGRKLTSFQLAWRFQVADLLMRYQHCWLLGLDGVLSRAPARRCISEEEERQAKAQH